MVRMKSGRITRKIMEVGNRPKNRKRDQEGNGTDGTNSRYRYAKRKDN